MATANKERTTIELNPGDKAILQRIALSLGYIQTKGNQIGTGSISGLMQAIAASEIGLEKSRGLVDGVNWMWQDFSCGFKCPCGLEIILTESGEIAKCQCGQVYRLSAYVSTGANK